MKQFMLVAAITASVAGGSQPLPTYEAVRETTKKVMAKKDFAKGGKPAYEIEDGQLLYWPPTHTRMWDRASKPLDVNGALVEMQLTIELFRTYPPKNAKRGLIDEHADKMDEIVKATLKDFQKRTNDKERLDKIQDAEGRISRTIDDAGKAQAKNLNVKYILVPQTSVFKITVSTKPPDGKVYMISDLRKTLLDIQGLDLKTEILKCAISGNTTFLEGKVWYYIEWTDKAVGPTSTVITTEKLILE